MKKKLDTFDTCLKTISVIGLLYLAYWVFVGISLIFSHFLSVFMSLPLESYPMAIFIAMIAYLIIIR